MSKHQLTQIAAGLPASWASQLVGTAGPARIKVVRMDAQAYHEETHAQDEALLVLDGQMLLSVSGQEIRVGAGELYIVQAGTPHAVLAGSSGTLVIIDTAATAVASC
nr:cupin domain-containing protein [Undibacterium terreum]